MEPGGESRRTGAERAALLLATLGGAGFAPVAPGTFGTLAAVPLAVAAAWPGWLWLQLAVTAVVILVGVPAAGVAERVLGQKDAGAVVIDEAAGLLVALVGIPLHWGTVTGAFLLFRFLDIVKPFPGRRAERLPGGLGIMTDDLVAGLYTNLALRAGMALIAALP